ncbi:hypothetical protein CEXT_266131 [Caerostris extrusa]|uniref:Uncharacterized protein n=1 Tax=Caerostris extrusa TaxID=172846 RepID=A0AAV4MKJ8_CAEEX|nr:hypothetical protein CEXT_266131 [Caerostris extrusa]
MGLANWILSLPENHPPGFHKTHSIGQEKDTERTQKFPRRRRTSDSESWRYRNQNPRRDEGSSDEPSPARSRDMQFYTATRSTSSSTRPVPTEFEEPRLHQESKNHESDEEDLHYVRHTY